MIHSTFTSTPAESPFNFTLAFGDHPVPHAGGFVIEIAENANVLTGLLVQPASDLVARTIVQTTGVAST